MSKKGKRITAQGPDSIGDKINTMTYDSGADGRHYLGPDGCVWRLNNSNALVASGGCTEAERNIYQELLSRVPGEGAGGMSLAGFGLDSTSLLALGVVGVGVVVVLMLPSGRPAPRRR